MIPHTPSTPEDAAVPAASSPTDRRTSASRTNHVVVIEDNDVLRELIVGLLEAEGHHVRGLPSAESLEERMTAVPIDILILDLNLPGEDGLSVARRLRVVYPQVRIIMVTARTHIADRVAGYEVGADIYLTKPFDPQELIAIVNARSRSERPAMRSAFSGVTVYTAGLIVEGPKGPKGRASVNAGEAAILVTLARVAERSLDTHTIMELIGKDPDHYRKGSLEVRIVRLREKLERVGVGRHALLTLRGVGYQLTVPVRVVDGTPPTSLAGETADPAGDPSAAADPQRP